MKNKKVLYEELRPKEFVEIINKCPVAYLPLGTLEWHGLHLPIGSDGLQAKGVFEKIASIVGGVVLPMLFLGPDTKVEKEGKIYYGMDYRSFSENSPQQLEGSAYYISDDKFNELLDTIMGNLKRAGFEVVIAHGHGPSTSAFTKRKEIFKKKFGLTTYNLWELAYEGDEGIQTDHAATNETSLVMALRDDLVDMNEIKEDDIPVGVWGEDPREKASIEKGKELIEKNSKKACEKIKKIVSNLPKTKKVLEYNNMKNMLRK